jgi:hypothetical protein
MEDSASVISVSSFGKREVRPLELETEIMIAKRQGFISAETESALLEKARTVGRLINGLFRHLTKRLRTEA